MHNNREKIMQLIDGELNERSKETLLKEISINPEMAKEFKFQKEIDNYMKTKFMYESAKKESEIYKIDSIADNLIKEHYHNESSDFEILEFISSSGKIKNHVIKKELDLLELDSLTSGVDVFAENWVAEYYSEKNNLDINTQSFIRSSFNEAISESQKMTPLEKQIKKPIKRHILNYALISSAALILIFFSILFFNQSNITTDKLYEDYYESYDLIGVQIRSSENNNSILFQEAAVFYENKQYNEAVNKFEALIKNNQSYVQAYFYLGLSQMESNQFVEANLSFNEVIDRFDEYEIESKWYIALCFLKTNNIDESKKYLEELTRYSGSYQKDAVQLLKELNK